VTAAIPASGVNDSLDRFVQWLDGYGEVSWDHQSYFAGPIGRRAKALYYRNRFLGTAAVAPMIFSEAFVPGARRLFAKPARFPIADAHYAMGFAYLAKKRGSKELLDRAVGFLEALERSRCPGYEHMCWGYPFDWETRTGTLPQGTPMITSTPYVYEAFREVWRLDGSARRLDAMRSIAEHAAIDIRDFPTSASGSTCAYTPLPDDRGGVVNAAAYRACLLASAASDLAEERYWRIAERNLEFVLESQRDDGSWFYSVEGMRDFVDHFHTCFVLKALARIVELRPSTRLEAAIGRGVDYYLAHLMDESGLPKPFSTAPRMTVYRRELYDYAECVNLCLLLRDRLPGLGAVLPRVVDDVLTRWTKPDGSFRSRELLVGWDNLPMHRWAQSQMFRSLSLLALLDTDRNLRSRVA
jgi:hypothetical protein